MPNKSQKRLSSPSNSPRHRKVRPFVLASNLGMQDDQEDEQDDQEDEQDDEGDWTKVEKHKSKKAKMNLPTFMYSNGDIGKRSHAVSIEDIRDLVLHLTADASSPNWLRIQNAGSIRRVVAVLIPGLTPSVLSIAIASNLSNIKLPIAIPPVSAESPNLLPFVNKIFSHACPTRAPGDKTRMHSILSAFFQCPLSASLRAKKVRERAALRNASNEDPQRYILSLDQMIENDYPIPSYMADVFQKPPGWVEMPQVPLESSREEDMPKPVIYAIDCEMCLTEDGNELTRVCVMDYNTKVVIYDQLVKPSMPILDYLTRWSGITPEALETATATISDVQSHLLKILSTSPTPILLGHSLESDLKALKLCHPLCIDTALAFDHPRGRPLKPGLAWLTKKWCGREIQTGGEGGHDPVEDATACIDLLKMKVAYGPGFGEFKIDSESICERMTRSLRNGIGGTRSAVVDHGNPSFMHGAKATTSIGCTNDQEVLEGLLQVLPAHDFIFARFMALSEALGWKTPKEKQPSFTTTPAVPPPPPPPVPVITLAPLLNTLNEQLTALHAALPAHTALILFTGHDDPLRMAHLNARKGVFERVIKSGKKLEEVPKELWWSAQEGRDLEDAVEEAKRGMLFIAMKTAGVEW